MWNAFWRWSFSTLSNRFFWPVKRVWFHPGVLAVVGVCLGLGLLAFQFLPGIRGNDAWIGFAGLLFLPFIAWLFSLISISLLLVIPRLVYFAIVIMLFLKIPFLLGPLFRWSRQYMPPELLPPDDQPGESENSSPAHG